MCVQHVGGQRCQPVKDRDHGAAEMDGHLLALDQALGAINVGTGGGVAESLDGQAMSLVPTAGPNVQRARACLVAAREALLQPLPEKLAKEAVIAVPLPLTVQGHDEEIGALEVFQGLLPRIPLHEGITERAAEPVENGGPQEEGLDALGLMTQDLLGQVVQHKAVAAGKRTDETGDILLPLHGQRSQLQAGDPAFGAALQGRDVLRRELQAHHPAEEVGRLFGRKAQVGGAQLGELAPGAEASEGQDRVLTSGDDEPQARRQVLEEEGELIIDFGGAGRVVVVEHEKDIPCRAVDLVDQVGEDRLGRRRLGRMEGGHRVGPAARLDAVQRGRKVEEKTGGVVVSLVQREPGGAKTGIPPRALVDPGTEQRGLPEAGRGGDEGERSPPVPAQALDQAGAEDCVRPGRRHEQLRGQDGREHRLSILHRGRPDSPRPGSLSPG